MKTSRTIWINGNGGLLLVATAALCLLLTHGSLMADETLRPLFEFNQPNASKEWYIVNDGVMGGVSDGRFRITGEKTMEFYGNLSLANNGGFASVRSATKTINLKNGDALVVRLRADGREYLINLFVPTYRIAFSYRAPIKTKAGEWIEVSVPLDDCKATSFGQILQNAKPLDPSKVNAVGFMLSDKKPGPFKLEVEWIKVRSAEANN